VSQQEYLFKGTIRETIAFSKPEASTEEIIKAATLAGIHDFINTLPAGYETTLSEGASNLSGGQRQRLAIARALLSQPRILLLDEPTSFLDAESERRIQDSMSSIRHDRTVFVVAHRVSTIREADLILVLDGGAIVERGTHDSLMSERGLYYYLTTQQLSA
jgi:ATP-binding cassette subfamily B protein